MVVSSCWSCVHLCACSRACSPAQSPPSIPWSWSRVLSPTCFPHGCLVQQQLNVWPIVAGLHRGQPAASQHCWSLTWVSCLGIFLGLAQQLGDFWHEKHSSGDLPIPSEGCAVSLALKTWRTAFVSSAGNHIPCLKHICSLGRSCGSQSLWEQMLQWSVPWCLGDAE